MAHRSRRAASIVAALVFTFAVSARAEELPATAAPAVPDAIYKGVVGNALELLPLEDEVKVHLQRTNAVVSGPLAARSLAALVGLTNPVLMIPGLVWGIWSALHINERKADVAKWLGRVRHASVGFCSRASAAGCTFAVAEPALQDAGSDTVGRLAQAADAPSLTR